MALFKPSRIIAVALVLGAAAWIVSGTLEPHAQDEPATPAAAEAPRVPLQKVAVHQSAPVPHQRRIVLSCTTRADKSSIATARANGVIVELKVSRGSRVKAGDVVAVLSDEGRESAVAQAQALLDQRTSEYEAIKRLIDRGDTPKNQLPALESAVAAAKAALASANAEAEKSNVRAPIDGVVDTVPVQVGQALQPGAPIAEIIDPDPMLAVGAVSERERGNLADGQRAMVRFIDDKTVDATVSFVGLSADKATRTYPVEARMANPDAGIADGVSCEMTVTLVAIEATSVPKSALVFSDDGLLGVRVVDSGNAARFVPVTIVDDAPESVWVLGFDGAARVIVVGQDFVKDGDPVEAVAADDDADQAKGPPA